MASDKRLMKLLKRAKQISQLYIELLQKPGSLIKNNSEKIELLKSKRNKAISNLEIPFTIAIANQDNSSRDWRELLYNNAEFLIEDGNTMHVSQNKTEFIARILVHSNALHAFKENLKDRLFVNGMQGKNRLTYDEKEIDDLIKSINSSVAEKMLKIDKTEVNLNRFIDVVTIEKINNCLEMELEKHNSQNNIIYKVNNIIQKRYKEYKHAYTNVPDIHKEKQNIKADLRSDIQKTKSIPELKDIEQDFADLGKVRKNKTVKTRGKAVPSEVEGNKKSAASTIKKPKIKSSSESSHPMKRGFLEDLIAELKNNKIHQVKQSSDIIPARVKKAVKEINIKKHRENKSHDKAVRNLKEINSLDKRTRSR